MTISPFFSVVIPTYNRSDTIDYCLQSVLAQTFENFEIILVDDGSTDSTVQIIQSYTDERIRCVVLDKNSGAQAARNRGIREAKGEWIAFQDSDDEWVPDKLERQYNILKENNFDPSVALYTNCFRFVPSTGEKNIWLLNDVSGNPTEAYRKLLAGPSPMFQGLVTSKQVLQSIGYLDEKVSSYQEWDTAIQLSRLCRFIHIKEPLFTYICHDGDTISKNKMKDIEGYHYIFAKYRIDIISFYGESFYLKNVFRNIEKAINSGLFHFSFELSADVNCKEVARIKYIFLIIGRIIKRLLFIRPINIIKKYIKHIINAEIFCGVIFR